MLGKVIESALGEAHDCQVLGTLVASAVPGMGYREVEQLVWTMSSAMPTSDDSCGEGGISFRKGRSIFSGSKRISLPLAVGTSGAMGVGLLREVPMGCCPDILGIALDRSSSISIIMLGWGTISLGHSVTECGDKIDIENC